jgi:hypothetical protein
MSSLVSQLWSGGWSWWPCCNCYVLHGLCNKFRAELVFETLFTNMGTKWFGWISKKKITHVKNNVRAEWWLCCEQTGKFVRLFLFISKNYSRKFQAWLHFVPSVNERLIRNPSPYIWNGCTRWRSGWGTALQTGRSRERFPMVSLDFSLT